MPRVYRFEVSPKLPARLDRLRDLALNLRWSWDHPTIEVFRSLDRDLWEETGHNPRLMLGRIDQKRLSELATDEAFLAQMDRAAKDLDEYCSTAGWFRRAHPNAQGLKVAYFSAEFGLTECIPNYAGGLGILAGDHLKSASDLDLPLVGVGLLYQGGYFRQYLNADGWQQETYPINDFYNLPIQPETVAGGTEPLEVAVEFPGRLVHARVWRVQVGRIPLYLLDTNVPENSAADRKITGSLYGGDRELRIQQEIVLGIGGLRALCKMGIQPTVCHMNEGHSAFLGLERARMTMQSYGLAYPEARQLSASGNVFTTHTPVPAGFDRFDRPLVEKYFGEYARTLGLRFDELMRYGQQNHDPSEPLNMAYVASRHSAYTNAVSRLHGEVTRKMVHIMWRNYPIDEVPIGYVTNGIHTRSWISMEMNALLTRYLGPRWAEELGDRNWQRVDRIPDEELWRAHQIRRERLIHYARARLSSQLEKRGSSDTEIAAAGAALDPEILTIGFARRFASYKRATLLLRDGARLKRILTNPECPVQILIAGKAHPHDSEGKELIRQIIHYARDPEVRHRMVFLEDYDISVARYLVEGVDVWLNTPRRPNEASGTSGMKLLANGGLNLSILDGWWAEGYDREVGWAIGRGEEYDNPEYQNQVESEALFNLLENDVVPLFYQRDAVDIPRGWIAKMKSSMKRLSPVFSTNRMVAQYTDNFYIPAHTRHMRLKSDGAAHVHSLVAWRRRVIECGDDVKIARVDAAVNNHSEIGSSMKVSAEVQLGRLAPGDVRVQVYFGPVSPEGEIGQASTVEMSHAGAAGTVHLYEGVFECKDSGSCGLSVRVVPYHEDALVPYELPWVVWAD